MTVLRKRLVTPPVMPITLADAKRQLRDPQDEDALIERYIRAAVSKVERDCDRAFGAQTWEVTTDAFPRWIDLTPAPIVSVTSVKYYDADGVQQTIDATLYRLGWGTRQDGYVYSLSEWPTPAQRSDAVAVRYVVGDGQWPEDVLQAVYLLLGHWFANREAVGPAGDAAPVPLAYDACLDPWRRMFA